MAAKKVVSREAGTGQFVTRNYAKKHPGTTVNEHVPVGKPGKKKR